MRQRALKTIKWSLVVIVLVALGSYVYFQTSDLLKGPSIIITSPENGIEIPYSMTTLEGYTRNISRISVNGRTIYIDEDGRFYEMEAILPGYNIFVIEAEDKYGKQKTKIVEVYRLKENI